MAFVVGYGVSMAYAAGNTQGWLWGGGVESDGISPWDGINTNVGWISASKSNCDTDGNGQIDAAACTSNGATGSISDYGLTIPSSDGPVIGYAWSENIGWVDLEPQNHCSSAYSAASCTAPSGGTGGVSRSGNNLVGWARIVEIAKASAVGNSGGWAGWIKVNGTASNGSPYSVTVNGNALAGYAWSDELGWVNFDKASIKGTDQLVICPAGPISLPKGNTQNFTAHFFSNYFGTADCNTPSATAPSVNWSSSTISNVSISPSSGATTTATGLALGTSNISATYNGVSSNVVVVTVTAPLCIPDNSCAANTCTGETCSDGCGGTVSGKKDCTVEPSYKEVAPQ